MGNGNKTMTILELQNMPKPVTVKAKVLREMLGPLVEYSPVRDECDVEVTNTPEGGMSFRYDA